MLSDPEFVLLSAMSGHSTPAYAYARNNPLHFVDLDGRNPSTFSINYRDMREANTIGADKYFHCKANCQSARQGGLMKKSAEWLSELREFLDENVKGDPKASCDADRAANDHGRSVPPARWDGQKMVGADCKAHCAKFRPPGLNPRY